MRHGTTIAAALLALTLAAAVTAGCSGTKDAVETTVRQGIETTSTGVHNTVPANAAQDAVDAANGAMQQQVPPADDLGQ